MQCCFHLSEKAAGVIRDIKAAPTKLAKGAARILRAVNPTGAYDLYVVDMAIPTQLYTTAVDTADRTLFSEKKATSIQAQRAIAKARRLAADQKLSEDEAQYLMAAATVVALAALLDTAVPGCNHVKLLKYTGKQPTFQDQYATSGLEESLDNVVTARMLAGLQCGDVIYGVPAPEISGYIDKSVILRETEELTEYQFKDKKMVAALRCGIRKDDLIGIRVGSPDLRIRSSKEPK
jgi:hypothetical protein